MSGAEKEPETLFEALEQLRAAWRELWRPITGAIEQVVVWLARRLTRQ